MSTAAAFAITACISLQNARTKLKPYGNKTLMAPSCIARSNPMIWQRMGVSHSHKKKSDHSPQPLSRKPRRLELLEVTIPLALAIGTHASIGGSQGTDTTAKMGWAGERLYCVAGGRLPEGHEQRALRISVGSMKGFAKLEALGLCKRLD